MGAHSPGSFRVHRERFLVLAAAIASSTCSERPPGAAPAKHVPAVDVPSEEPAEPEAEPVEEAAVASEEPSGTCDNDAGEELDCTAIARRDVGPACEGLSGSCSLLANGGYGYRRRVAAEIVRCWERLGARVCDMRAKKECNREAISKACPDPQFEKTCQATLDRCTSARASVDYSLAECVQVMSSLHARERDWAISAMGPAAEGCRLMFPVY